MNVNALCIQSIPTLINFVPCISYGWCGLSIKIVVNIKLGVFVCVFHLFRARPYSSSQVQFFFLIYLLPKNLFIAISCRNTKQKFEIAFHKIKPFTVAEWMQQKDVYCNKKMYVEIESISRKIALNYVVFFLFIQIECFKILFKNWSLCSSFDYWFHNVWNISISLQKIKLSITHFSFFLQPRDMNNWMKKHTKS